MTIKITCGVLDEYGTVEKSATKLEKDGFVPITMSQGKIDNRLTVCILMYKKE